MIGCRKTVNQTLGEPPLTEPLTDQAPVRHFVDRRLFSLEIAAAISIDLNRLLPADRSIRLIGERAGDNE